MPFKYFLVFLLLIMALVSCKRQPPHSSTSEENVIEVGEIDAITGSEAAFGGAAHQGIEFAIEELNSQGGIHGKKIKLILMNDQGRAEESTMAVKKLLSSHKIVAMITGATSSRTMAMAPIAQLQKVPLLATAATHPKVTQQGDFIFRVSFTDSFQGLCMAQFAKNTLGLKRVAILSDTKNDYSLGLSEAFQNSFLKGGGEIVDRQYYSSGDIDFKGQLTSFKGKQVQAIFVPGYYGDVGLMARQAASLGLNVPLLGGDGWDSPRLTEIAGKSISGSFFSGFYSPEDQSKNVQDFVKKFKKRYGSSPDAAAALGYEGMLVLAEALRKSDTQTSDKVRSELTRIQNFDGLGGKITINSNRDAIRPVVVMKVTEAGRFEYQSTVTPQ